MHVRTTESPKTVLHSIAIHPDASAAVRARAARLLGNLVNNKWPLVRRQSRESALKGIAGDASLPPRTRLNALQQLLFPGAMTAEEEAALRAIEEEEFASKQS